MGELKELAAVDQDRKSLLSSSITEARTFEKQKRSKVLSVSKMSNWQISLPFWPNKSVCWYCRNYAQYQDLTLIHNNTKSAVIYSAYELSSLTAGDVTDILTKRFNSKLDVVTKVAPELIGGIKVEVGDQVLDLSVQGKLNALYATMTN